ncbi:MAG: XRE family transcriptional regulator [Clostridiales bacterium]|nr:XRE family transcriptional regulator [Clostridiales bacterium]
MIQNQFGSIHIKLAQLLEDRKLSKNMLSHLAHMQRDQINHYGKNTITRLDVDVLARICSTLQCDISDLLEYVPPHDSQDI